MSRNWAFWSGCELPSIVLRLPCMPYSKSLRSRPTVRGLTGCIRRVNSCANWVVLLSVHRKGDWGSPRVVGSTKLSKAYNNCGTDCVCLLHHALIIRNPGSSGTCEFSSRAASSSNPLRMVLGDMPITPPTARKPPQLYLRDSAAAAHCLRMRSSINMPSDRNLDPIAVII